MSSSTDRAPTRRRMPLAQTTFAKRMGVNRSTISRAMNEGGPLRAAMLPGRRVDIGHPAAVQWARAHGSDPKKALDPIARILASKRPPQEPASEVADDAMSLEEFAERAEMPLAEVKKVLLGELRVALLRDGRVRAACREALEFMAQHPFRENEEGRAIDPKIDGRDFLAPTLHPCPMPDAPNAMEVHDHAVLRIWLARRAGLIRPLEELPIT